MLASYKQVLTSLKKLSNSERAKGSARFFKTAPGQYGHGDSFWGVTVPQQRQVVKDFKDLPLAELKKLLTHPVHECRLTATLILVNQYRRAKPEEKNKLAKFYLAHARYFNNWDLVDSSAGYILGDYLLTRSRLVLKRLAKSKNLWERRIAIIATQAFIAAGEYEDTLTIAKLLMTDEHDLIHKAVGWMLREVGKKSKVIEERFLKQHAEHMPRTMLRYAIEKFPASQRRRYLILKSPL